MKVRYCFKLKEEWRGQHDLVASEFRGQLEAECNPVIGWLILETDNWSDTVRVLQSHQLIEDAFVSLNQENI